MVEKGVVIQLFWESYNPVTGGSAKDLSGSPITEILPGGSANERWNQWMDRIADWLVQVGLTQAIFRPFHENTGNWFWWGASACTPASPMLQRLREGETRSVKRAASTRARART